ncbi:non-ribosomal peptide synthetase [Streptomyces sp. SP18CS02]|uniref:non-ribosomal peptide synthetase n=1 Tax=Streptomyces sp. SP18CS02 TaxID=3002531 RepID=UPI002E75B1D5|nr:amino acid adenylation domain-containing protein [Streptomyces sp. SP18CS02]MEE1757213.1 amino acid adenylation domain-containing protein [Streptomyces sp. SP18CS02]
MTDVKDTGTTGTTGTIENTDAAEAAGEDEEYGAAGEDEEYEFPLSDAQSRLLVLDQLDPGSAQYHVPAAFLVRGPFDMGAFHGAMDALVARHEALRTVFRTGPDGSPVQIVSAAGRADVRRESGLPAEAAEARMRAEAARPFDTAAGPLLRARVYATDDGAHRVLLVAHHLVCDGWSLQVILRDLSAGYAARLRGVPYEPPDLPLQYPDYAAWQRERMASGAYDRAVEHWAGQLRGAPATVALPLDRPRPAVRSTAGGTHRFALGARVRERLAGVAGARGATPFMALFAAYAAFLGRLSGSEDLVIGFPVSGRDRAELQDMVGMLTNTLALRVDLGGDPSYGELIGRLRERLVAARPHEDAPFEAVVDAVAPARETSHDPVVQVVFAYDDDTDLGLRLADAEVSRSPLDLDTAKFDLHLHVERWGEDLSAQFIHRAGLFDAATVGGWAESFRTLLDGALARPDVPLSHIDAVAADERARVLAAADRTAEAAPADRLVPDLVADRAAERPDAVALVCGAVRLTYRELLSRADALAGRLRAAGVRPGVRVGLLLPRSADMGIAALAVLRAGGAYVPLDPAHPEARLVHMVEDSGTSLLLTAAGTDRDLGVPRLRVDQPAGSGGPHPADGPAPGPRDAAYVLYTSGSTGVPKGVTVEHRALVNLAVAVRPAFPVTGDDRVLQFVSSGFDVAVSDLFFPWVAGAELHIALEDERLGEALFERLRDAAITYVFLPPSAAMLLPDGAGGALPALRTLAVGGEACPAELVGRLSAPGRRIVNAYGPSEATVYATTADLRPGEPVVIGQAVPGARVCVLDARLRPVPVGVAGEIYVAGASLARGYTGQPGMTAERFVADPYGPPGTRMYRTGDLGRFDARGVLHYLGRTDAQVKLRGFRIELGEVEAVLTGVPGVAHAAAAVHDRRLVAYVVGDASDGTLRARLAERLPGYMVPDVFVRLDALPLNRSGKVDRARLPGPPSVRPRLAQTYSAPDSGTENHVARVWARVLTLDRVGAHDNFFDLGGNSVRLLAVLAALRERYDEDALSLVDLFRYPTVAALAAHLDRPGPAPEGPEGPADGPGGTAAARRGGDRRARQAAAAQRLRSNRKGIGR